MLPGAVSQSQFEATLTRREHKNMPTDVRIALPLQHALLIHLPHLPSPSCVFFINAHRLHDRGRRIPLPHLLALFHPSSPLCLCLCPRHHLCSYPPLLPIVRSILSYFLIALRARFRFAAYPLPTHALSRMLDSFFQDPSASYSAVCACSPACSQRCLQSRICSAIWSLRTMGPYKSVLA